MKIFRKQLAALAGCLLVPLAASAAADEYASWRNALTTIKAANFKAIEELETTTFGGFEAEVFDVSEKAFELQLAKDGSVAHQRQDSGDSSNEERIDIASVESVVEWLQANGYRGLRSISADDRSVEVEADDASGKRVELDLELDASGIRLVHTERD